MDNYDPDLDISQAASKLVLAMQVIAQIGLEKITASVEMAHTLGPFIDPTKYRDALYRGDMDSLARLAEALKPAVKIWNEEIAPKIPEPV